VKRVETSLISSIVLRLELPGATKSPLSIILDSSETPKSGDVASHVVGKTDTEIMPVHVHLLLNCPPTLSPSDAMFRLKGYSSRILREKYVALRRMPSMWTRSFFVSTAGNLSSDTIQKYIAETENPLRCPIHPTAKAVGLSRSLGSAKAVFTGPERRRCTGGASPSSSIMEGP
jgi:hypothetical protein